MATAGSKAADEIARLAEEVDKPLRALADIAEDGESDEVSEKDLRSDLREALAHAYTAICAALEKADLNTPLESLKMCWDALGENFDSFRLDFRDQSGGVYANCAAREALQQAMVALLVARATQDDTDARDSTREKAKRDADRKDAETARSFELRKMVYLAAQALLATAVGGIIAKASCSASAPPPAPSQLIGELRGVTVDTPHVTVDCAPSLPGVHVATASDAFTIIAEPTVPRPLTLFCSLHVGTTSSPATRVTIPTAGGAPETPVLVLPGVDATPGRP